MTKSPRQFSLKDGARSTHRKLETLYVPFGPAGEVLPEGGCEELDATREWLRHVEAGRIGKLA